MKYAHSSFVTCVVLLFAANVTAQTKQKLNIDAATVFLNGAELISSAKLTLAKGENEILFTNVAGEANKQSLTISASNGVVVEAATFQNNYLEPAVVSPHARELKDSIEILTESENDINTKIAVIKEEITILQGNRKVSGDNTGLSVAELVKMLDLINTKMEGYLNQKNKLDNTIKKTDERVTRLKSQLDEEQKRDYQPGGQLLVKFYAAAATTTEITINYIAPDAGWSPTYDIMADNANSPIKLFYKANIHQNCGVNWNNVRLTLSTGNPNEGAQAPTMNPWYLAFYVPPPPAYKVYNNNSEQRDEIRRMPTMDTQEITDPVTGVYQAQRGLNQASLNNYVSVDNAGINTTFDIDLPYTIPTDGQLHLVAIKKYELPATYRYYTVPKLDKDVFLQAQVTNWEDLNLLPGTSNIFYEGTYVGQGSIDVRNIRDTMTLSLGRDKKIVVKRERDTKLRSVKMIGANVSETFAYSISIRNTRKESITLIVQDQLPVSNDKDIVIEDKNTEGAEYNETSGMLKWTLTVNENETKKFGFGYTVKYSKGKIVSNL